MTPLQQAALEALATLDLIESVGAAHYVFRRVNRSVRNDVIVLCGTAPLVAQSEPVNERENNE